MQLGKALTAAENSAKKEQKRSYLVKTVDGNYWWYGEKDRSKCKEDNIEIAFVSPKGIWNFLNFNANRALINSQAEKSIKARNQAIINRKKARRLARKAKAKNISVLVAA